MKAKLIRATAGACLLGGLLLAGSESPYFPLNTFLGAVLMTAGSLLANYCGEAKRQGAGLISRKRGFNSLPRIQLRPAPRR